MLWALGSISKAPSGGDGGASVVALTGYSAQHGNMASSGQFTLHTRIKLDLSADTYLATLSSSYMTVMILSSGRLRVVVKDDTNVNLGLHETALNTIVAGTMHDIVVSVDLAGQVLRAWVDGSMVLDVALAANTGLLASNRYFTALGRNGAATVTTGELEHWELWWGTYVSDGVTPGTQASLERNPPSTSMNSVTHGGSLGDFSIVNGTATDI